MADLTISDKVNVTANELSAQADEVISGDTPGGFQFSAEEGGGQASMSPVSFGKETAPGVISPETVEEQPDMVDLPEDQPDVDLAGQEGFLDQTQQDEEDKFTKDLEKEAEDTGTAEQTSFEELIASLTESPTREELEASAFAVRGGVDEIKKELDDINSQIRAEKHSLRRKLEAIDRAGGGLKMGAEAEKNNLRRQSLRTQADLAVLQMSVQGRYDTALEIANRAVDAEYAAEQRKMDVLSLVYERNKSLFDKTEQRLFETQLADRNRELEAEKQERQDIYEVALAVAQEGGDTATIKDIMNSETRGEAIGKTRGMLGVEARLRRQKLQAEINDILTPKLDVLTGTEKFNAELKLADTFDERSGDWQKANTQITNIDRSYELAIQEAKEGGSINAASQGVLVAFQKLLDPTSVVRESEYARSGNGLSMVGQIDGYLTKLKQGGAGLTAEDLEEFVNTANEFLIGYENAAIDDAQLIMKQANSVGLNVNHILPDSILTLMEDRFIEAIENTPEGETVTVGETLYKMVNGELIPQ
jgi:hypothetical protein